MPFITPTIAPFPAPKTKPNFRAKAAVAQIREATCYGTARSLIRIIIILECLLGAGAILEEVFQHVPLPTLIGSVAVVVLALTVTVAVADFLNSVLDIADLKIRDRIEAENMREEQISSH